MLSEMVFYSVDEFFSHYDEAMEPMVSEPILLEPASEIEMDLELGILESVQNISIDICRTQQSQQADDYTVNAIESSE
jgi:hypothetical protein